MGGAPPPPLGAAPQAPKIRKNSALWRAGFGRVEGPRITPRRGGGGALPTALIRGQREAAGDSPPPWAAVPAPSYPARSTPQGRGSAPGRAPEDLERVTQLQVRGGTLPGGESARLRAVTDHDTW